MKARPYCILGAEMGLGKTLMVLDLCRELGLSLSVVCPAYLKENWKQEIEKFTPGLEVEIFSYASLKNVEKFNGDVVCADEAHYLKNLDAKRTQKFHTLIRTNKPKRMILASGSPVKNRVGEFFSLLQLCHYGGEYPQFSSYRNLYYKFCNRFSYERTFEVNGVPIVRFEGVRNNRELAGLIKPIYLRQRVRDVIDLPEKIHKNVIIKNKSKYDTQMEDLLKDFDEAAYMTLKKSNAIAKVPYTIKLVEDTIASGEQVVVYSDHIDSIQQIADKFKVPAITGAMDSSKRMDVAKSFISGEIKVLAATIGSFSTGVTLTVANHMVFNDIPFVPTDIDQAEARIHRIGQKESCFYYRVYLSEMDEKLTDMVMRKMRDVNKVVEV